MENQQQGLIFCAKPLWEESYLTLLSKHIVNAGNSNIQVQLIFLEAWKMLQRLTSIGFGEDGFTEPNQ